jgi:hypothetical protein
VGTLRVIPCGFSPQVLPIVASGSHNQTRDQRCGMTSCSTGTTAIIALSGSSPRQHKVLRCSTAPIGLCLRHRAAETIAPPAPPEQGARPSRVTG